MKGPSGSSNTMAAGCLALFGLPFFLIGVFLVGYSLVRTTSGLPLEDIVLPGIAGVAFGAAGLGIILAARFGKRKLDEVEALRAEHPAQPWLWNPEWAAKRVRSVGRGAVVATWIMAVIWNSVSAPILFVLPDELANGNNLILIGLVFPLVGAGLIVWSVRVTLRWRKFGVSELVLATNPVPIGGMLNGFVQTRLDAPPETMRLRLNCVKRRQGSGDDGSTESLLWQDEAVVSRDWMRREPEGTIVPVAFRIPADAVPSDRESTPVSIHWRLQAEAAVAGVDYESHFDVPVFHGTASLIEESRQGAQSFSDAISMTAPFEPAIAKVKIAPGPGGGTEFRFGAARSPGAAFAVTFMALIFSGATVGLRYAGAPLLFPIAFGFFSALLVMASINLWLTATSVEVANGVVTVRVSVLGIGWTRSIETADIVDIGFGIGMSQQQTMTQSPQAWYDIALRTGSGRKVTAGRHIKDRREAEWVVTELKRAVGLEPQATTHG